MPLFAALGTICGYPMSIIRKRNVYFKVSSSIEGHNQSRVKYDSLRVLEWDKLCDCVASFARTSLGRQATKAQLWSLDQTFQESLRLLQETNAAILMHNHGSFNLDLTSVDLALVKSAIKQARRGLPIDANAAMALVSLLQFIEALQLNLKAAIKEDSDWYKQFMPLSEKITQLVVNRSIIKLIQQVIDEDGTVKDSASSALKKARHQVRMLERKLHHLVENLIRNDTKEASLLEASTIDGRWCIRSGTDQMTSFKGLLLSSGSGLGSIIEPLAAVPLNDELQQARALVDKAEADVLLMVTEKIQMDLDDIEKILRSAIQLDIIYARATYSHSFGGTYPNIYLPEDINGTLMAESYRSKDKTLQASNTNKEWILYLRKAYHPLLLQQHRQKLHMARKDVRNATAEIRRRKLQGENMAVKGEADIDLSSLEMQFQEDYCLDCQVRALEEAPPVPTDFFIAQKTRVLVITGPNTGGKTICLKTVGLAAIMAKSGLHVLSSESAKIPWFDSVFADIGDEQSLSQSLSTFSGRLKQISEIRSQSTSQSLVLLDEVGAGTNPLEGAALGMSLLESFAKTGALLTIATTHHGELKTLKYSNDTFENACMEFDEENLKPTYKILWGVPGRSNAINIAERLGVPSIVVDNARELYGPASAEIDEVIIDMETFKQSFQELIHESRHYLMLSRSLHEKLLLTRRKLKDLGTDQRYKMMQVLSEAAAVARSTLHKRVQQLRTSTMKQSQLSKASKHTLPSNYKHATSVETKQRSTNVGSSSIQVIKQPQSEKITGLPKVGDMVHVSSLGKRAMVLRVDTYKEEIVVQAGNMKLKLKLIDVQT
ncbi:PREDICTED: endonuclease MutS2 isoform X1 [Theobroma cacao]|uniref:Endonuclease MutS2 isoform X1 n=1 Tax=Theobroma cacao TaxID=3641 RepID=A0AB32W1B0_THECC|nr:PREDICTED: endonuclease MutS2 isoform X1 [Theobroma cacao]